jgi:hypothetical protein
MANPTYQRITISDSTDVAARIVAAAETELQPDSFDGADDYFATLAQKIKEQSGKGDSHSTPIDEGGGRAEA